MTLQSYEVSYSTNGGTWTALTNVQNLQLTIGRQQQLDQIKASTGSVTVRYPTGYASPITDLVTGTYIRIRNNTTPASPYDLWTGQVTDIIAEYGIPYSGGVGPSDYLQISIEGVFANLGRMEGNDYAMPAGTIASQMSNASTQTGMLVYLTNDSLSRTLAATTVSSTWADWVSRVCQSTNSRLWDGMGIDTVACVSPFLFIAPIFNFSDVVNDRQNQVYNQISFNSYSNNYYTQVSVSPESFGSATVTAAGATRPFRTYETNTINASTAQANSFAEYLLNNYSNPSLGIASLTCSAEAQNEFRLDKISAAGVFYFSPGTRVSVTFRGTVYQCVVEGVTMSSSPSGSTFTFYFSDADLNSYLILDDSVFGKLNENKLAY